MLIYPAIDLRGGQVVRLREGDYDQMTVYDSDPRSVAERFKAAGATCLHVVDLDGAKDGTQTNLPVIREILSVGGLFVEVGGGGRDESSVARYMDLGVNRMILGTLAIENGALMEKLAARYPGRIACGVDARDGEIYTRGWRVATGVEAMPFLRQLPERGVDTVIYTDIARDGMEQGANLPLYQQASEIPGLNTIASGGLTFDWEIERLRDMGLYGAIVGKALYTGALPLEKALRLARGKEKA